MVAFGDDADQKSLVVCFLASDDRCCCDGEVKQCFNCGVDVWFSAISRDEVARQKIPIEFGCPSCARETFPDDALMTMPSDEQIFEIAETMGRSVADVRRVIERVAGMDHSQILDLIEGKDGPKK